MPIFVTEKNPNLRIYVSRLGKTIQFEKGRYETDDPAEIKALRRNRQVTDFSELERELTAPAAVGTALHEGALSSLKREELDQVAEQAGVENPEKLGTKGDVIGEIEERAGDADRPPADS